MKTDEQVEDERESQIAWRKKQLIRLGLTKTEARMVSERLDISLHEAISLLEHGCSAELMIDILW